MIEQLLITTLEQTFSFKLTLKNQLSLHVCLRKDRSVTQFNKKFHVKLIDDLEQWDWVLDVLGRINFALRSSIALIILSSAYKSVSVVAAHQLRGLVHGVLLWSILLQWNSAFILIGVHQLTLQRFCYNYVIECQWVWINAPNSNN